MKKKILLASIVALSLALLVAVGGSIAWLVATSGPVENEFAPTNIGVTLSEIETTFDMVPASPIDKDPLVTVSANSVKCYVFLKVDESANLDSYIAYNLDTNWKLIDGTSNVYYQIVDESTSATALKVLVGGSIDDTITGKTFSWGDNQVLTLPSVTKQMMSEAVAAVPTLTFNAAAVQFDNLTVTEALAQVTWNPVVGS